MHFGFNGNSIQKLRLALKLGVIKVLKILLSKFYTLKSVKEFICDYFDYGKQDFLFQLCKYRIRPPDKYFAQREIGSDFQVPILQPDIVNDPESSITAKVFVTWLKDSVYIFSSYLKFR